VAHNVSWSVRFRLPALLIIIIIIRITDGILSYHTKSLYQIN